MKKFCKLLILLIAIINCLCILNQNNVQNENLKTESMHEINQAVDENVNYKKAEFSFTSSDRYQFFKYDNSTLPSSRVSAFRIDFNQYYTNMSDYKVFCTSVDS